ncbi:hypothetical protein L1K70_23635, partial [Salmonella enterica subsp. enterica serovar Anatum]|nr:hypothetical protein [Salmonella enterica subsp. enterica serovar Anatum]
SIALAFILCVNIKNVIKKAINNKMIKLEIKTIHGIILYIYRNFYGHYSIALAFILCVNIKNVIKKAINNKMIKLEIKTIH